MRTEKRQKNAFTLVELLVVVAIISVLAGLLLPALRSAQAAANTIRCQSNFRNIGMMVTQYGDDYNGLIPGSRDTTFGFYSYWQFLAEYDINAGKLTTKYNSGCLLHCPNTFDTPGRTVAWAQDYRLSYAPNIYAFYYASLGAPFGTQKSFAALHQPSRLIFFAEVARNTRVIGRDDGTTNIDSPYCYARTRHRGGSAYLFGDGHVTFHRPPFSPFATDSEYIWVDTNFSGEARFSPISK